jgi:CRP-like cAMP-binding protein
MTSFFDYPEQEGDPVQPDPEFLAHWDDAMWKKLLAFTEQRRFLAGETIIRKGERDGALYILTRGALEVLLPPRPFGKPREAGKVAAGSVFGEQAFLDGQPRSASVRAVTEGELLALSRNAYERFVVAEPGLARDVIMDLARTLSARLRRTNAMLTGLLR